MGSLWTWPGSSSGSWIPILGTRDHTVFDTLSVCVLAAVPSQGELGGRKPSPPEPDPALEPAEPDASGAEHGEQGAVPRGAEAVHVRGMWAPAGTWALASGSTPGVLGARGHASLPAYPLVFPGMVLDSCEGWWWLLFAFKGTAYRQKLLNLLSELSSF